MTSRQTSQMANEIAEQPEAARRTLDALLPLRPEIRALMGSRSRVLLVARGSSDNAAIYGRYLLETAAGVPAGLAAPSVATHYGARLDLSDTLVVAVSQSGETTEIVQTQAWAASCGAATVAVTNGDGSTLATEADLALVTRAGPELAVPATKTYLTQLVAMAVLADGLGGGVADALAAVPDAVSSLLSVDVAAAAHALDEATDVVVSGRGLLMGTALETALKLEETCLQPVRGYSYADLRHGPISVVTSGVLAVLVAARRRAAGRADGRARHRPAVARGADPGDRRHRRVPGPLRRAPRGGDPARDRHTAHRHRAGPADDRAARPRSRPRPRPAQGSGQGDQD